ncbi:MAG: hypothetical protein C0501_14335 [Isosphaera sp.]|nr:hypothetical protein [Isosphaera sp.]
MEHTFHTRHDFTPDLGWAAFQLLAAFGTEGVEVDRIEKAAQVLASPLAKRADLRKLLRSMEEIGLVRIAGNKLALSGAGIALSGSAGRYPQGFFAGVHCLYSWTWLWSGQAAIATPAWSYRQVCRAIRTAGPLGIESDAVVLSVTGAAGRFNAERVSFSRSSVNGVTAWLRAQSPPLLEPITGRLHSPATPSPGLTCVRFQAAALCRHGEGEASLTGESAELLADALLIPPAELRRVLEESLAPGAEFHLLGNGKRIAYRSSVDPFLEWIVHGQLDTQ